MKEHPILRLLRPIAQREVWRRAAFSLAATWAIAAVVTALLLQAGRHLGIPPLVSILTVAVLGLVAGAIGKLACSIAMIGLFLINLLLRWVH